MNGVDWSGMRDRYRPLVDRVGSRAELNDVIGEMMSELRNSHAYVSGGDDFSETASVSVGALGVDLEQASDGWKIARILPDFSAINGGESPLAKSFREVKAGQYVLKIDDQAVNPLQDPAELLVDKGGKDVQLMIADTAAGDNAKFIEITMPSSDHALRYFDWVESNRKLVDKVSGGKLGYIHLPDMDSDGLISFMRTFIRRLIARECLWTSVKMAAATSVRCWWKNFRASRGPTPFHARDALSHIQRA